MNAGNGASATPAPGGEVRERILVINDPHIADRPPLGRKDDYRSTILSKLYTMQAVIKENEITQVVITGDVFHYKNPKHLV